MAGTVHVRAYTRSKPKAKRKKSKPKPGPSYGSQPHQRLPTRAEAARMRATSRQTRAGL